jgi:hypothetical protein
MVIVVAMVVVGLVINSDSHSCGDMHCMLFLNVRIRKQRIDRMRFIVSLTSLVACCIVLREGVAITVVSYGFHSLYLLKVQVMNAAQFWIIFGELVFIGFEKVYRIIWYRTMAWWCKIPTRSPELHQAIDIARGLLHLTWEQSYCSYLPCTSLSSFADRDTTVLSLFYDSDFPRGCGQVGASLL